MLHENHRFIPNAISASQNVGGDIKMVTRSENAYRTPPGSRGNSPSRILNRSTRFNNIGSPNKNAKTYTKIKKLDQSSDQIKAKVEKLVIKSRGSSPARTIDDFPRSRGSEFGSIERLDDDNNLQRIITSFNQTEDNINVVVRVRPLNNRELKQGDKSVIQFPGSGQLLVDGIPGGPSGGQKPKLFSYNVVFESAATQEDVLQFSGMKRLIEMALEGFRCTCFCYGQTGSGKTHTLTGPPGLFGIRPAPFSDNHGLVFRSFLYLFHLIQQRTDVHFVLKASYLEIYNEKVIDLLNPGSARKPLAVRWSKKARGFFVENLFTVDCEEFDDLIAVLEEGLRNRAVGKHNMNDFSSRSHTILTVYITSEQPAEGGVFISRSGKINFVDLAGSEMTKKTQSEGKTLEEANNINKSLMVLGYCISSLSDSRRKSSHIPYRDSKLTKLLADSLAGNGVTLMIACISPAKSNLCETINTLRYAARAKKIRTKPIIVMDPREALILTLKREVTVLQSENEHLRSALNVYSGSIAGDTPTERGSLGPSPQIDYQKLAELEGPQLADLVRLYIKENETLRRENSELFSSRDVLQRDHELVCRENERLLKKLEEVNSSPLIPARASFSAELLNSDSNYIELDKTPDQAQIPESIQKELDKRQIKNEFQTTRKAPRVSSSESDKLPSPLSNRSGPNGSQDQNAAIRRYSVAKPGKEENNQATKRKSFQQSTDIFGSVITLTDDED